LSNKVLQEGARLGEQVLQVLAREERLAFVVARDPARGQHAVGDGLRVGVGELLDGQRGERRVEGVEELLERALVVAGLDLLLELLDGERLQVLGAPCELGGELLGLLDGALADDEEAREELHDAALAVELSCGAPSRQSTTKRSCRPARARVSGSVLSG
jgi:hypothetical protein